MGVEESRFAFRLFNRFCAGSALHNSRQWVVTIRPYSHQWVATKKGKHTMSKPFPFAIYPNDLNKANIPLMPGGPMKTIGPRTSITPETFIEELHAQYPMSSKEKATLLSHVDGLSKDKLQKLMEANRADGGRGEWNGELGTTIQGIFGKPNNQQTKSFLDTFRNATTRGRLLGFQAAHINGNSSLTPEQKSEAIAHSKTLLNSNALTPHLGTMLTNAQQGTPLHHTVASVIDPSTHALPEAFAATSVGNVAHAKMAQEKFMNGEPHPRKFA